MLTASNNVTDTRRPHGARRLEYGIPSLPIYALGCSYETVYKLLHSVVLQSVCRKKSFVYQDTALRGSMLDARSISYCFRASRVVSMNFIWKVLILEYSKS